MPTHMGESNLLYLLSKLIQMLISEKILTDTPEIMYH